MRSYIIIAFVFLSISVLGQPRNNFFLMGTVVDAESGEPIENVKVSLRNSISTKRTKSSLVSGVNGFFLFDIGPSKHTLKEQELLIEKKGYVPRSAKLAGLQLNEGQFIKMRKKPLTGNPVKWQFEPIDVVTSPTGTQSGKLELIIMDGLQPFSFQEMTLWSDKSLIDTLRTDKHGKVSILVKDEKDYKLEYNQVESRIGMIDKNGNIFTEYTTLNKSALLSKEGIRQMAISDSPDTVRLISYSFNSSTGTSVIPINPPPEQLLSGFNGFSTVSNANAVMADYFKYLKGQNKTLFENTNSLIDFKCPIQSVEVKETVDQVLSSLEEEGVISENHFLVNHFLILYLSNGLCR